MKERHSKSGIYIIAAAVVIAILATITASLGAGGTGFANLLSEPIFKPVKSVMTSMVRGLEEIYGYMYLYDETVAENQRLKDRIHDLEEEYREYTEISQENDRLRALLDFDRRHAGNDYVYESASIISWTASNFSSSFTINKGSSSGISRGDSVITDNGYLVGTVTAVTASSSTVTTVIDTSLSLGAMIYGTGETGVVEGDFELFKAGRMRLAYIDPDAVISVGDTVVTSGSGGTLPGGLVIGHVESLGDDPSGLDFHAIVTPAVEMDDLSQLFVIKDFSTDD